MSKKFAVKVVASLALGGAAMLIAPGIALADDGGDWANKGHEDKSWEQCDDAKGGAAHGRCGLELTLSVR